MKWEEYCPPFEGDMKIELIRLLGDELQTWLELDCKNVEDRKAIFDIAARLDDLTQRINPNSSWIADTISVSIEGATVLDVGCHTGVYTVYYAMNHPSVHFIGMDLSPRALDAAKTRARLYCVQNISWVLLDALSKESEPYYREADVHILQDVVNYLDETATGFLHRTYPLTRNGAVFIIENNDVGKNPQNVRGYSTEDMRRKVRFNHTLHRAESCVVSKYRKLQSLD